MAELELLSDDGPDPDRDFLSVGFKSAGIPAKRAIKQMKQLLAVLPDPTRRVVRVTDEFADLDPAPLTVESVHDVPEGTLIDTEACLTCDQWRTTYTYPDGTIGVAAPDCVGPCKWPTMTGPSCVLLPHEIEEICAAAYDAWDGMPTVPPFGWYLAILAHQGGNADDVTIGEAAEYHRKRRQQ